MGQVVGARLPNAGVTVTYLASSCSTHSIYSRVVLLSLMRICRKSSPSMEDSLTGCGKEGEGRGRLLEEDGSREKVGPVLGSL